MRIFLIMLAALVASPAAASDWRGDGKLVLTDGITTVEGAAGGGIATWAVIAGNETERGVGATAHASHVALPDFDLEAYGGAVGLFDRVELSYTRQSFDTRGLGAALGLGRGFTFQQDVFGAKVKLFGDAVWDQDRVLPQVSIGVQHKRANRGAVIAAVGGADDQGTDYYVSATKLFLAQSLLVSGTVRLTEANQLGLLGHGGDKGDDHTAQFEGSAAVLLTRKLAVGGEFRTKPDRLSFAQEDDAYDVFAAWSVHRHVTLTAAYADLGDIATVKNQRGLFVQLQAGF
ncbi:DUF3034 family protein [Sphingomonas lenta]|uniref:DUF3034 domain-containing protein n=1 Tax=Sphingomonas lenta TaxID=1141887 RepID=A0A2A2SHK4_9SPHN|nr:DUF3034 family protein [Sphingomonas lenta]PAX08650.1 hypothetical protein CKY28_04555 [Sphingomonas lenta]